MMQGIIISDTLMFGDGLKCLLLGKVEILAEESDVNQAIAQIKILKPDIVIWANTGMKREAMIQETRLLDATPDIKTISLNLQNNEITIYDSGQKTIRVVHDTEDLIEAIKGEALPLS